MKKIRIYNDTEINTLLNNKNIEKIFNKCQIVYKNEFKLWAVKEKINHIDKTARQIFEESGFDMNILDDRTPQRRLCSWLKKYRMFGEEYFTNENKYSYKAKEKSKKIYLSKTFNDPNFQALIIEKKENGSFNYNVVKRLNDEETNS